MSKPIYKASGQLRIFYLVTSIKNKKMFVTEEVGTNSSFDMYNALKNNSFKENARLNAIYRHMAKGGTSTAKTEYLDHDIHYYEDINKTQTRKYKSGTYYVTTNTKTGKVTGRVKKRQTSDEMFI